MSAAHVLSKRTRQYNADVSKLEKAKGKLRQAVKYDRQDLLQLADHNRLAFALLCEEIGVDKLTVAYEPESTS